jgi:beta-galactosidase beta subunit
MQEVGDSLVIDVHPMELQYLNSLSVHIEYLIFIRIDVQGWDRGVEDIQVISRHQPFGLADSTDVIREFILLQEIDHEFHIHLDDPQIEIITPKNPHKEFLQIFYLDMGIVSMSEQHIDTRLLDFEFSEEYLQ